MTSTREDAAGVGAVGPGERSVVPSLRGLRWWGSLLLAGVLTAAGLALDMLASGEIGVVFTACFAGGCILATAWARRDSLFVPLVQPPLLLAVGIPVVVAATGSLPRSGGLASTLLAVGGPLVNAFPTLAVTTAICLALGFVRTRVEPFRRADDDLDPDARPDPRDRPPKDRPPQDRPPQDRPPQDRPPKKRPPKDRDPRDRDPRDRPPPDRDPRDRDPRDRPAKERPAKERPPKDRDPRERDPRDRPPPDRDPRDRDPRDRDPRDRPAKERPAKERPPKDRDPRDRDPRDREPPEPREKERPRRVQVETRPARDDRRRPADERRRPVRPDDPDDEFGPGVRRVPRRVDGPDGPR